MIPTSTPTCQSQPFDARPTDILFAPKHSPDWDASQFRRSHAIFTHYTGIMAFKAIYARVEASGAITYLTPPH